MSPDTSGGELGEGEAHRLRSRWSSSFSSAESLGLDVVVLRFFGSELGMPTRIEVEGRSSLGLKGTNHASVSSCRALNLLLQEAQAATFAK